MRSGDRVRITAQLIEAPNDRHLWPKRMRAICATFSLCRVKWPQLSQKEVKLKLSAQEEIHLANARPVNPEAHEAYLRGSTDYMGWRLRPPTL